MQWAVSYNRNARLAGFESLSPAEISDVVTSAIFFLNIYADFVQFFLLQ